MVIMILVTGATGNVGRQVVDQLLAGGAKVRATTRRPDTAGLPDDVEVVGADMGRPETVAPAFAGTEAVFLMGARGTAPTILEAAARAGVRRVVFLSSLAVRDATPEQPDPIAAYHAETERD